MDPKTRAWIILLGQAFVAGGTVGMTSFLGGTGIGIAIFNGLLTAATNIVHNLMASPSDKAERAKTAAPFDPQTTTTK